MIPGNDCDDFFERIGRGWGIVVSACQSDHESVLFALEEGKV